MFTAFMVGAYALGTKDAMLTTDSDTYVYPDAIKNMMALLFSDCRLAGVTGDVRIWNKSDSFLALMSSIRYWFAFNVERACQSAFGCVGCLSGPLGLYKTSDLISILDPWILQSFLGKETTFGDDRHLSNRILSLGHRTGYVPRIHRAAGERLADRTDSNRARLAAVPRRRAEPVHACNDACELGEVSMDAPLVEHLKGGKSEYRILLAWLKEWVGKQGMPGKRMMQQQMLRLRYFREDHLRKRPRDYNREE
ncbi:hypothetical protein WOLCODRAFT_25711 [Wolfiporia cocos MD-104 SS10]|uniref:Glycosyltransferase family 2 protein n=1 Tax=Wolfiporia cocos (strain MD-104) TaxID=742152 RepID=A0A2H3JVZ7_WOLCO|nr:hypothetical protein WOLCODRAFT_25711 [Wolfiporia cocos MD-104 SS10]